MVHVVQPYTRIREYSFDVGDRVRFRTGGGMGKIDNWAADAASKKFRSGCCTVTAVNGTRVSIRDSDGKEDTVQSLWLVPASE